MEKERSASSGECSLRASFQWVKEFRNSKKICYQEKYKSAFPVGIREFMDSVKIMTRDPESVRAPHAHMPSLIEGAKPYCVPPFEHAEGAVS